MIIFGVILIETNTVHISRVGENYARYISPTTERSGICNSSEGKVYRKHSRTRRYGRVSCYNFPTRKDPLKLAPSAGEAYFVRNVFCLFLPVEEGAPVFQRGTTFRVDEAVCTNRYQRLSRSFCLLFGPRIGISGWSAFEWVGDIPTHKVCF